MDPGGGDVTPARARSRSPLPHRDGASVYSASVRSKGSKGRRRRGSSARAPAARGLSSVARAVDSILEAEEDERARIDEIRRSAVNRRHISAFHDPRGAMKDLREGAHLPLPPDRPTVASLMHAARQSQELLDRPHTYDGVEEAARGRKKGGRRGLRGPLRVGNLAADQGHEGRHHKVKQWLGSTGGNMHASAAASNYAASETSHDGRARSRSRTPDRGRSRSPPVFLHGSFSPPVARAEQDAAMQEYARATRRLRPATAVGDPALQSVEGRSVMCVLSPKP